MTVVLGVDPGSRHTGFGVIRGENGHPRHLASRPDRRQEHGPPGTAPLSNL